MKKLFTLALLLLGIDCFAVGNLYLGSFQGDGSGLTNVVLASSNLIPAGATFSNNVALGYVAYQLPTLATNQLYYVQWVTNNEDTIFNSDSSFSLSLPVPVMNLTGISQPVYLYCEDQLAGEAVRTRIYGAGTNIQAGKFGGQFDGILTSNTMVPDSALSANVQFGNKMLNVTAHDSFNGSIIASSNSHYGSTLNLWQQKVTNGSAYCDINFTTDDPPGPFERQAGVGKFRFAIGVGITNLHQFPYDNPYIETYEPFFFIRLGTGILGGLADTNSGDFVWYSHYTNSADTNGKQFEIIRSNYTTAVYGNLTVSTNITLGGTVTGNGSGLTNLNANNIASGTIADARLSANVPLLNGNNIFTASNQFQNVSNTGTFGVAGAVSMPGVVTMVNSANTLGGTVTGNGAGLTNLTLTNLPAGDTNSVALGNTPNNGIYFSSNNAISFSLNGTNVLRLATNVLAIQNNNTNIALWTNGGWTFYGPQTNTFTNYANNVYSPSGNLSLSSPSGNLNLMQSGSTGIVLGGGNAVNVNAGWLLTAKGNIFLTTNTTCPTPVATGGYFWASNQSVLYWVTTTHTNYIAGP